MMTLRRFFLSLLLMVMCTTAAPAAVLAFDPFGGGDNCTGKAAQEAAACRSTGNNPLSGEVCDANHNCRQGLFLAVADIVAYLAGAIAVIMIIAGSIKFITSGSDVSTGSRTDTEVEDAKRMIASALIGLVVIIFAKLIITYVVRRL